VTDPIRKATPADLGDILQLIRDLAAYEREPDAVQATVESLHGTLFGPTPTAEAIVAEVDGEVVGVALYFTNFSTWSGRDGLYLEDLYVKPEARGTGLGKALLRRIARIAVARGCARVEWAVLDWNAPAIAFYRSLGAVAKDEWTVYRLDGDALAAFGSP
jgi:GNAT superfamily N-acetyltransferase